MTASATIAPWRRGSLTLSVVLMSAAVAWAGVLAVARHMGGVMPGTMGVGLGEFVTVWALMMTAMMLPTVAPFAMLYSRTLASGRTWRMVTLLTGYLAIWAAAALPSFGVAWLADRVVGPHPAGATALAVIVFAACGVYQLTPLKDRCLAKCRSPLGFVFRFASLRGWSKELRVGLIHGAYCLGCCWALMALLVALGLMNVIAMVALTAVVLLEKVAPWGAGLSRVVGVVALGLAVAVVFDPGLAPGLQPLSHARMTRMT